MPTRKTPPQNTAAVFGYLVRCARQMRTVTYQEVAAAVGTHWRTLGPPLGHIRDKICTKLELPWLNALVVNGKTRRPGHNFLPTHIRITNPHIKERLWRGTVLQVFAYDWSKVRSP